MKKIEFERLKSYFQKILINTWAIGRDPNVWSDNVGEFYPERFINSNVDLRGHDFQLLPFGSGRRGLPWYAVAEPHGD